MGIFDLFSKPKPEPQSEEDVLIERAFSRKNDFVDILYEMNECSPGRRKIKECFNKIDVKESFSYEIIITDGGYDEDIISINRETKPYIEQLIKMHVQSRKVASIIYSLKREKNEIFLAELMPAINLMIQVEQSLKKGVPISHDTIQSAVFSINDIVEKALDNYYSVNLLDLNMELRLAKEIQIEYQKRREKWVKDTKAYFEPVQINKSIK